MTTLHEKIVADLKAARFQREDMKRNVLTTLLGELDTTTKRTGKPLTDEAVVATIKKFVENAKFTMSKLSQEVELYKVYEQEAILLRSYLPLQMSEAELSGAVLAFIGEGFTTMGEVMSQLKYKYAGLYDGKMASAVVKKYVQ